MPGKLFGPVHIALANPQTDEEPWDIISDAPTSLTTLAEYALRFDIEENFLDDKSNGFQAEATQLDDAPAIARLFLVLAVATLHLNQPELRPTELDPAEAIAAGFEVVWEQSAQPEAGHHRSKPGRTVGRQSPPSHRPFPGAA